MRCLSKYITRYPFLAIFSIVLLAITACANQETPQAPRNPTPKLEVVAFATEAPITAEASTPEAINAQSVKPEAKPTQAATVGSGVSQAAPQPTDEPQSDEVQGTTVVLSSPVDRPPDVNPLTGLKVDDPAVLLRRPLMVRVGNDPGARPQVALSEADVVYEEIVEWWVTRFTAIYLSQDPEMIAPIRSARLISTQLTPQYQGALANSGGSDGVRWQLSQIDIVNLDEFFAPQPYFYRPNEGWQTRLAVDATAARDYMAEEGLESEVKLRGFFFSEQPDLTALPQETVSDAKEVAIPYPELTSATRWAYDSDSGKYLRFVTDEALMDFNGGQIAAANVIIYFADHQATDIVEDTNGATSIRIIVNGKGKAWVLRDGRMARGNWETNGNETPLFTFDNGQPMPLKPGNTWVQVLPLEYAVEIDGASYGLADAPASTKSEATTEAEEEKPTVAPTPTLTPIGARP